MRHNSVKLDTPCEFINITPVNPLISKCQIKVCYVDEKPNRNRTVITKEVAKTIANSLPGSPIVGYFRDESNDYEEHNRIIKISDGEFKMVDETRPYGFVDLGAKVWFQKFLDDGVNEREYLMTEGYIWTGQYPEAQDIINSGKGQSMELDENSLNGSWTKDNNGKPQFFIINEAIISKLCILGEDFEPCFEGASITKFSLSFEDSFKNELFSMMNELKELLKEGGATNVFTTYAVEIGDNLFSVLYKYIEMTYPDAECKYCSKYRVDGVFEEGAQKFAVLQDRVNMKYYRLNFSLDDSTGFTPDDTLIEVTKTYIPAEVPQFSLEDMENFEIEYKKKKEEEEKDEKNPPAESDKEDSKDDESKEDEKDAPPAKEDKEENSDSESKSDEKKDKDDEEEDKKKKKYTLDEVEEYVALKADYEALSTQYSALKAEADELRAFKNTVDKKEKEAMIESFYMLSDNEKKDVIDNIDKYTVDEIEAKLSVICVRNKVNFNLDDDNNDNKGPTTYNLNNLDDDNDAGVPAWVKAALAVANKNS